MKIEDIGKEVVIIVSETETAKGKITAIHSEFIFEIVDKWGNLSRWNEAQIKGYKFKGDA